MATSGTTSFTLDVGEIIAEAYERIGTLSLSGRDYRSARRSLDLMMVDWGNRGMNLWKVNAVTVSLVAGTQSYTLGADVVDVIEGELRTGTGQNQQDYSLNRVSVSTWAQIPNKLIQSRPVEFYVDRQANAPILYLWPMPDAAQTYTLALWTLNRIQDAGTVASNNMDIPWRFLNVMCAGLAFYIGQKRPDAVDPTRLGELKGIYDETWEMASSEDRTRASVRFVPFIPFISGSG
jgi:hypothetical protein